MRYLAELESPHASTSIFGSVARKGHLSEIQAGELSSSSMVDLVWDATISGGGVIKNIKNMWALTLTCTKWISLYTGKLDPNKPNKL